jgi:peptide-methionine (R)-S-oxide reductase
MRIVLIILPIALVLLVVAIGGAQQNEKSNPYYHKGGNTKLSISNADWKKVLDPKVYNIMRQAGTESPDTGPYVHNYSKGTYYCASCGHTLFSSAAKFDSHTGWPSFFQALNKGSVIEHSDNSLGMERTEVLCACCGGHLGHVFDDGPAPTHMRYCMNGYALMFEPAQ